MPFQFNPITGNLDLVGDAGGVVTAIDVTYDNSGSGLSANNVQDAIDELASIANYSQTFNATSDWTSAAPVYKIDITQATHSKGLNPQIQVFELVTANYVLINTDIVVDGTGLVSVQVTSSPDLRFQGKVIIS